MNLHEYVYFPRHPSYIPTFFKKKHSFESITIPHREDPRHSHLSKRWDSVRPLGMFKSTDQEFLLCYDGIYRLSFLLTASF